MLGRKARSMSVRGGLGIALAPFTRVCTHHAVCSVFVSCMAAVAQSLRHSMQAVPSGFI